MRKIVFLLLTIFVTFNGFTQWNMNTSVNLEIAGLPVADMHSLTTSTGKTWVAFYHQNSGNYDMRAQLLDVDGTKLLGPNGVLVSNKPSGSATFVFNICKDESDNLVVAFQDERNGAGSMSAVVYKISQSGAQLWGADGIVLGNGLAPYPGLLSNNEVVVAWIESTANTLKLQKITTTGTAAWSTPIQVTVGASLTTRGQVVANTAGTFNLVFQKKGFGINTTLYSQRYTSSGTAIWAAPLQISTESTAGVRYYSVQAEGDTTYCGYYSSIGSRFNSWLQRINPDGTIPYGPNGSNFSTNTGGSDPYQQNTNMVFNAGSPYVWSLCSFSNTLQSQYGVYVQKFSKVDGSRLLGSGAQAVYPISANFDSQAGDVSLVNDGPVFMTYDANYKIYATRLDANGAFVWTGNRIELSSTTASGSNTKGRFGFTALSNTQAVGVWYEHRGVEYRGYAQNITPGGLFGLDVSTQGNVPAIINTNGGVLQMLATIFPNTANQSVNWSIVSGTGSASINSSGLVTAQSNGTVWAKAISQQDGTVSDSLELTISNQTATVNSVLVTTQGSVPAAITTLGGTLQMVATVNPSSANQSVTWSVVPVTGTATINASGLVTAQTNGIVWAKATSVANPAVKDSMQVTISNQTVQVEVLVVTTQGSIPATISAAGGSLQMVATISPSNATNQSVIWSIVPVTGTATINASGLVTAQTNGTVWAKAISVSNPAAKDSMQVTISNQTIQVAALVVTTQGSVPATITTASGNLQMIATISPSNATNQSVTWSLIPVTGTATINASGLVTAQTNGTIWAKAISVSNAAAKDSMLITISGQLIPVTRLQVVTQNNVAATINSAGGTLQLQAIITPSNASNLSVVWTLVPVTGSAIISSNGLVTASSNGTVWGKAVSVSNSLMKDSLLITITGQDANAQLSQMIIYPNPTYSDLHLKLLQSHPALKMTIANAAGQIIHKENIAANELRAERILKLDKISAGLYILYFKGEGIDANFKFVKL